MERERRRSRGDASEKRKGRARGSSFLYVEVGKWRVEDQAGIRNVFTVQKQKGSVRLIENWVWKAGVKFRGARSGSEKSYRVERNSARIFWGSAPSWKESRNRGGRSETNYQKVESPFLPSYLPLTTSLTLQTQSCAHSLLPSRRSLS